MKYIFLWTAALCMLLWGLICAVAGVHTIDHYAHDDPREILLILAVLAFTTATISIGFACVIATLLGVMAGQNTTHGAVTVRPPQLSLLRKRFDDSAS